MTSNMTYKGNVNAGINTDSFALMLKDWVGIIPAKTLGRLSFTEGWT